MRETAVALVGCGWISEAHVGGYRALWEAGCRDVRITACCDVNPAAALSRAHAIAAYQGSEPAVLASVDALGRSGLSEAADICLPHCFHHQAAIPLLGAGLHVLLEKPLGITVRASRAIIAAANRAGRILATAENTRRHLGARASVWAIQQGMIGEPLHGACTIITGEQGLLDDPKWAWRSVRAINGGGPLIDGGAHFADMMQQLFGRVASVRCTTRQLQRPQRVRVPVLGETLADAEDWWHASLTWDSGMQVEWTFGGGMPGRQGLCAVYQGSEGALIDGGCWPMHPCEGGATLAARSRTLDADALSEAYLASLSSSERERRFPYGVRDSFAIEIWDFVDAIRSSRRPEMTGEDGLAAKAVCLACYESAAQGGRSVRVADVLAGEVDAYQRPIDARWELLSVAESAAASLAARR